MTPLQNELPSASKTPFRVGEKLRTVRENKGYTLKMVAKAAGVSESLVSQIERNHISPAIDTLLALTEVLDINLEFLFEEYRRERLVHITRAKERAEIKEDKIVFELLSNNLGNGQNDSFESYLIKIPPHSKTNHGSYGHIGREFGLILKGVCTLNYEGHEYSLEEGDSVSFSAACPHTIQNNTDEILEAVWTVTPPQRFVDVEKAKRFSAKTQSLKDK